MPEPDDLHSRPSPVPLPSSPSRLSLSFLSNPMHRVSRMSSILPVLCTVSASSPVRDPKAPKPAHHNPSGTGFVNPWPSFKQAITLGGAVGMYKEWKSHPVR